MNILTAAEAKTLVEHTPEVLSTIMEDIQHYASSGDTHLFVYKPIPHHTRKFLIDLGYIIKDVEIHTTVLTGVFHIIYWQQ